MPEPAPVTMARRSFMAVSFGEMMRRSHDRARGIAALAMFVAFCHGREAGGIHRAGRKANIRA
jgi:hypothetical protein